MPEAVYISAFDWILGASALGAVLAVWAAVALRRRLRRVIDDLRRTRAAKAEADLRHDENLRAASELIVRLKQEQQALELAKERFLEVVSHELRTPLSAMTAALEILRLESAAIAPLTEWVGIVQESCARLTHIVQRIEEMVRLDATFSSASFTIVGLESVAQGIARRLEPLLARRPVRCRIVRPDVEIGVAASEPHLLRLLELLLENAIQFSPAGATVDVRCEPLLHPSEDRLHIQILDRGPGIPEADLRRVFDSFHQVRAAEHYKPAGLGLGLSISRSLAASFGSEITARRREPNGSALHFDLPLFFRDPNDRAALAADVWSETIVGTLHAHA